MLRMVNLPLALHVGLPEMAIVAKPVKRLFNNRCEAGVDGFLS